MMECKEVRKNLENYASGKIKDNNLLIAMENHINTCYICKKELSMWNDVLDSQKSLANLNANLPIEFKDRIKKRMSSLGRDPYLPLFIKQIKKINNSWSNTAGMLIFKTILAIIGIFWLVYSFMKGNIIAAAFILLSILSFSLLSIRKK